MHAGSRVATQELGQEQGLGRPLKVRKNWQMALTRFRHNGPAMVGLALALFSIVLAVIAPLIAPYDPAATNFVNINTWPSRLHLFGTDGSGSDIFSITILSLRTSYTVALIAQGITLVAGLAVGMIAGYFGSWIDTVLSRLIDVLFSFPNIIVAILIAGTFGVPMYTRFGPAGRLYLTVGALSLFNWAGFARVIRSDVLRLRSLTYVEASIASGGSGRWIITRHMLPNILGIAAVLTSLGIGNALTLEAVLSYLGLGVTAPTPSLGRLIQAGQVYIDPFWYQFLFPAVVLALMVLAYAFIGDGLRDALDPRLQQQE
ncbi:MAG TPA: ABC transporter permease [Thermomicrobiaceae bacterium]|nr:ABC transporter permease [Thermomicrobiaceae bacterium]